jgi:KaiC/GvpD/RAD55 family RecA-like ATPase
MERIPFGVNELDSIIGGGAPPGSVVLLSGEAGAGSREFLHTSAMLNGLAESDPDLHDLYYGDLPPAASLPDEIHYVSFTAGRRQIVDEIAMTLDDEIVDTAVDEVTFHDLSEQYFHVSPVPRSWYAERTASIKDLRARHQREGLLGSLGTLLTEHAAGNLVVIDSLSDLVEAIGEELEWSDITYLVKGLQKAAYAWEGLILVHLGSETVSATQRGQLLDAVDGTMQFSWETGGSTRARTLVVQQFRGVLSRIEGENIVQFETEIGDDGFDISSVRKIR